MFRSAQAHRTFLTVVFTYILDLIGFSIVFPVLAPLLLDPHLHFFAASTQEIVKTTVLGLIFALFGVAQFFGGLLVGALADHYGRYKVFLGSIGFCVFGYAIMALSIYLQNLTLLFAGRIITGFCSGNYSLAQSAVADLTDEKHRGKAFGILLGMGGFGFVIGPWIGGKLANPDWLFGSGAFIFAAAAAFINFFMVLFFFTETSKSKLHSSQGVMRTIKDIGIILHHKTLRVLIISQFFYYIGLGFFLIFGPTFLVQRFSLGSTTIGDFFAYGALWWAFGAMYLNKELLGKFSLRSILLVSMVVGGIATVLFITPSTLWPFWIIFPLNQLTASLGFTNFGTILSKKAPENMQGRVMGAGGSMWAFGQIIAPLVAGPMAGWNIYSPLLVGALFIFIAYFYFLFSYKEEIA